jgi:glycosyltransferase involved in cell wall biosynthesis
MPFPRSAQVARLLDGLDASVVLLCGANDGPDPDSSVPDETIAPGVEGGLAHVIREPYYRPNLFHRYLSEFSGRYFVSWSNFPDAQRGWVGRMGRLFLQWQRESGYTADVVLTFGQPMSDHLFGAAYKRKTGKPWIAHFSDPWIDSPYSKFNALTSLLIKRLERQVIDGADAVLFTSPETLELVMRKYPQSWRSKAHYLPHCHDRARYDKALSPPEDQYVLRSVGSFYGKRSPKPLFEAIERVAAADPSLLEGVSFEFVGISSGAETLLENYPAARRMVKFTQPVPYAESLNLMRTAHCLLVIDAPADVSVFFPSKLVDYSGSERFIWAITPKGTSARIVEEMGGFTSDPANVEEVTSVLMRILERRPSALPSTVAQFSKEAVQDQFTRIVGMVHQNGASRSVQEELEMQESVRRNTG